MKSATPDLAPAPASAPAPTSFPSAPASAFASNTPRLHRFPDLGRRLPLWIRSVVASALAWAATTPGTAQDCMRWVLRSDVGDPGPQARHAMAYHRDRGTTCLVGSGPQPDVWEYDGRRWNQVIVDGPVPQARQDAGLVYDPVRKVLLLVGGLGRIPNPDGLPPILIPDDKPLADVWAFHFTGDGRGFWSRQADLPIDGQLEPGRRLDPQLAFDDASGRVFLYGATARNRAGWLADVDLLTWDGTTWTRIALPAGAGVTQNALAYDSRRRRVLSYGGLFDRNDPIQEERVWAAHGQLSAVGANATLQPLATGPQRLGHRMVFDSRRDRLVVFGGAYLEGSTSLSDRPTRLYATPHLEFLLGKEPISIANPVLPGPAPEPRSYHGLVYDERRGVTVLYGGLGSFGIGFGATLTNTWELAGATLRFTRQPLPVHATCIDINTGTFLNPPVELAVEVDSTAFVRYQWRRQRVPLEGPAFQANRLQINANNFLLDDAWGYFDVVASTECGTEIVSDPIEVRAYGSPAVTAEPVSRNVCPGDPVQLTTAGVAQYRTTAGPAAGRHETVIRQDPSRPVFYAWERVPIEPRDPLGEPTVGRGTPIPGATQATFRIAALTPADNGYYRCVITDGCGQSRTRPVELTAGAWIRRHPVSLTNTVCQSASLAVAASGKGTLRYRWRRNQEPLADDGRIRGAASPELVLQSLRYLDDAEYDCVVSDDCLSVTSRVASISVQPNPPFLQVDEAGPPGRSRGALVFDSTRGVSVLFGGFGDGRTISEVYRDDTWEYDGTNWTRRLTANAPSGRSEFAMAFDPQRSRVVLFGGFTHNGITGGLRNGETWEYDGSNWTQQHPARAPAPRNGATLFFDPVRRVVTLFGGDTEDPLHPRAGDFWNWDGQNWSPIEVPEPKPRFGSHGSPPSPQMVWSDAHGHAVLPPVTRIEGGALNRATWTWDGTRWTEHPYAFEGFDLTPNQAFPGLGLVYDSFRREVVYWAGTGTDQERVWRWNGATWRRDDLTSQAGWHAFPQTAYDSRRHAIVQVGGLYTGADPALRGLSPRTYERLLADQPVLVRQPTVDGTPGAPIRRIRLVAAGAPPLTYEWQRDGVRLTNAPALAGTTNATLVLEGPWASDQGSFRCVVRSRCGETVSAAVRLTEQPALALAARTAPVGGSPGLVLQWSEPNAVLESAPSPAGPWTPVAGASSPFTAGLAGTAGFYRLRAP